MNHARLIPILAGLVSAMVWAFPAENKTVATGAVPTPALYQLQSDDEVVVRSLQVKEMADKTFKVDARGEANFPLIGRISLQGKTAAEAEDILTSKLKKYYLDPDIQLAITPLHTEGFSVIGEVGTPGIHQLKNGMTLLDGLSAAGGLRPEAGPVVVLTREKDYGPIPQPDARTSLTGESIATLDLKNLLASANPAANVILRPHDVISVPGAQIVYVIGNVKRAGGFTLSGRPDMSVLQALALAEGMDSHAKASRARILRRQPGGETQILVDLTKILAGKAEDLQMYPNDILFVPNDTVKVITARTIESALAVGTGLIIWRR